MKISIEIEGAALGAVLGTALGAGLSLQERAQLTRELLSADDRRHLMRDIALISAREAAALVGWTPSGFLRRATEENCPSIKMGHKQPTLFQLRDVEALFDRLKLWPAGRPIGGN